MSEIDLKKLKMQRLKAEAAIAELEFKIAERGEDIKRMKDHITIQQKRIGELDAELSAVLGDQ